MGDTLVTRREGANHSPERHVDPNGREVRFSEACDQIWIRAACAWKGHCFSRGRRGCRKRDWESGLFSACSPSYYSIGSEIKVWKRLMKSRLSLPHHLFTLFSHTTHTQMQSEAYTQWDRRSSARKSGKWNQGEGKEEIYQTAGREKKKKEYLFLLAKGINRE